MHSKRRGLHELYRDDPERADDLVWGRRADPLTRRGFLGGTGYAAMSAAVGASIPFAHLMPSGLIPAALADSDTPFELPGKEGLVLLNDRPINAETPPWLLDDEITPAKHMFVRNNGLPPATVDPQAWRLEIGGESCLRPTTFSIEELKRRFAHHSFRLVLECGGNGRSEFNPPASGNQWTTGAVACPEWTGVRLRDVLDHCGIRDDAVYVGYYGADTHLSGDPGKVPISRGVPMHKAIEDETLVAWAMNGEDMHPLHGHPLRLVCGGWPASTCGKWLRRLVIRDRIHDGEKMGGSSYRIPCDPVAPGTTVPDEDMCIIESMPVKSLITFPRSGLVHDRHAPLELRGHAWAGDLQVRKVLVSKDFGATWSRAELKPPANRLAWQRWHHQLRFDQPGYYEVWARAEDEHGVSQPMVLPGWNPKGYLNNACHRIAVRAV
ncbi:MAG: sulfite oxidase [Xanthomonadales bacterium]|nr:sulfite oxidase [Xanthomonadales bacterium]